MRKFYTFFILFCLGTTLQARPLNLNQAVERAVSARTVQAQKQTTTPKPRATQQVAQADNTWYGRPIISWAEFQRQSQQEIQRQEKLHQLYSQMYDLLPASVFNVQQGVPDYAHVLAHTKYIYIGEEHETPIVQQEIKKLIQTIRKINPGKKILLATEFLNTPHPLVNPLRPAQAYSTTLVQDSIYSLLEWTTPLHIDTLALDDVIIQREDSNWLLKVGEQYIHTTPEQLAQVSFATLRVDTDTHTLTTNFDWIYALYFAPFSEVTRYLFELHVHPQWPTYKKELTQVVGPGNEDFLALYSVIEPSLAKMESPLLLANQLDLARSALNTIQVSTWGVLQRNRQWAQRIKQVENNYDIIIVWGGRGHMDDSYLAPSTPTLLAHPEAISFIFSALERDSFTGDSEFYQQRAELLHQQQLEVCSLAEVSPETADRLFHSRCAVDTAQTYFIEIDTEADDDIEEEITQSPREQALLEQKIENLEQQIEQLTQGQPEESSYQKDYVVFLK